MSKVCTKLTAFLKFETKFQDALQNVGTEIKFEEDFRPVYREIVFMYCAQCL